MLVKVAAEGATADLRVTLQISGQGRLALTTKDGRLSGEAEIGKASTYTLVLNNDGTAAVDEIEMAGTVPTNWKVEFNPKTIATLAPNEKKEVQVMVTPADKAIAGDYVASFRSTARGESSSADFRITVTTSTLWGLVGIGIIAVADTVKNTSKEAVQRLRSMGIEVYMITGDNKRTAAAIAKSVGITNVLAEVLPEQKANEVKKLQEQGKKVVMVGDGINDSPALAQAELGIAMGSGTDIAMETGGVVLVKNDLRDTVTAIKLSRATVKKIKQNMFFALFFNVIGIPIAARAFIQWDIVLRPELAGLAMAFSSVAVVTNSLLLKGFHPTRKNWLSDIAPFVMIIGFTIIFLVFARISS